MKVQRPKVVFPCPLCPSLQVATDSVGCSRGFAFVDMSSSDEADRAQAESNGMVFVGQEMRVAFSMPCRPGACILQHKAPQLHAVSHTLSSTLTPPPTN